MKKNVSFQERFARFGLSWEFSDADFTKQQMFTCTLYGAKNPSLMSTLTGTNCSAPYKHKLKGTSFLRVLGCLYKHCQCACYQTAVWKRALDAKPEIPSPIGKGWIQDKGDATALAIDWMEGLPAPDAVLELMSCSCTRVCKAPQCKCIAIMNSTVQKYAD